MDGWIYRQTGQLTDKQSEKSLKLADIIPAVHNGRSSISRVISSESSSKGQQGSWIFRYSMIWPHSKVKLFNFSLLFFTFLKNTEQKRSSVHNDHDTKQ